MALSKELLDKKLEEVAKHYMTAKKHLLFSETYFQKISLGVINEFRNSYDHLMRGIVEQKEEEFNKSISHLRRAAYDACELISLDATRSIHEKISKYNTTIITEVLPEYYSDIYPRLISIQKEISIEREKNDNLFSDGEHLAKYTMLYDQLINIDKKISRAIIGMEEYKKQLHQEKKRENRKNILINIVVGIVVGIVAALSTALIIALF